MASDEDRAYEEHCNAEIERAYNADMERLEKEDAIAKEAYRRGKEAGIAEGRRQMRDELAARLRAVVRERRAQLQPCEEAGGAIQALRGKLSEAERILGIIEAIPVGKDG